MKTRIILGAVALALGLFVSSCNNDEDYSPATGTVISSVQTGSSDVTANSAVLNGIIEGLGSQKAYTAGFYYGFAKDQLTESVSGSIDGNTVTATISGLKEGQTVYYQTFVTLQGKVTYKGEVMSTATSNAAITTGDATEIGSNSAIVSAKAAGLPADAVCGFVFSTESDADAVYAGLAVNVKADGESFSLKKAGLLPGKKYYYAAFMNIGAKTLYGEVKSLETEAFEIAKEDIVDLGLSIKWLKYNIGATKESELGGLYAYGDLDGCQTSSDIAAYPVNADVIESENDLARATFGFFAMMPTADQLDELFRLCEKEWTSVDGVAGMKFTGPNGNSIFLPAAGSRIGNDITGEGESGKYYSGQVNKNNNFAYAYEFNASTSALSAVPRFQGLSIRPVSKGYGFNAKLTCFSNAEGGADDAWASASEFIVPEAGKQFSLKFTTSNPRSAGSVFVIDIENMAAKYPNAFIRVDEIKKDGKAIQFNAQRFFYGDIEGKGNYRIEMANIWGKGTTDWSTVENNPFTKEGGKTPANGPTELAFNETFEVTFTVVSLESDMAGKYDVNFITINPGWGGTWGSKFGEIEVKFDNNAYSIKPTTISGKYEDASFADGTIMTFFEVADFPFMQPDMTFNSIKIDGTELSGYDKSKIVNTNEGPKYRYELWNCYGATKNGGCAFGTADGDVMKELGFKSSVEVSITMNALGFVK